MTTTHAPASGVPAPSFDRAQTLPDIHQGRDAGACTRHHCARCGHSDDYSGTGPHTCPGCGETLHPATFSTGAARGPVALLRDLDRWLEAAGYGADHPWRVSIAEILSAEEAAPPADAALVQAERTRHVMLMRLTQATAILGMVAAHALHEDEAAAAALHGAISVIDQAYELGNSLTFMSAGDAIGGAA